jgi:ureidoglycolate hydrolase
MQMKTIELKTLGEGNFSRYGEAYLVHEGQKPDISGEGWGCWYPLGKIETENDVSFGIVRCQPSHEIHFMERHLDRVEYLMALDRPVIQPVGFSSSNHPDSPDEDQTEAFVLYPGQILKILSGIWHSAAIPLDAETTKYLFLLGKPTGKVANPDSGQTRFARSGSVLITLPS